MRGRAPLRWAIVIVAVLGLSLWTERGEGQGRDQARVEGKMRQFQELMPKWLEAGGTPDEIGALAQKLDEHLRARDLARAEEVLDKILAIVKDPRAAAQAAGPVRVRLKVYDAAGRAVPKEQLVPKGFDGIVTGVYALDVDYNPVLAGVAFPQDGEVTLAEPVPTPLVLNFFPRVDGFGRVKVYVDNGGKGYVAPASGPWEIDLPLEATRSRVAKTRDLVKSRPANVFRKETLDRLSSAEQHLSAATRGATVSAGEVYQALNDALWAGEMATLDAARADIAKRGRRAGFKFGFFTEGHENLPASKRSQVFGIFNFATVPDFFLRSYEFERGRPRQETAKRAVEMLEQLGIEVKGHPLIYLLPPNFPPWLEGKGFDTVMEAQRTRVVREVAQFRGRVKVWDVINEPNFSAIPYTQEQIFNLARLGMKWVKDSDPAATRILNVNWPTGEYVVAPNLRRAATKAADGAILPTPQFLKAMWAAGVDLDVIGIEMYYLGLDMMEMSRLFDRYAKMGKPIHVTEVAVASAPGVDRKSQFFQNRESIEALGEWHAPWSESLQADWVEQFYTIAYSKPGIEAVSWANLVDSFWPFGGILRRDFTPKESYFRLRRLLESWGFGAAGGSRPK